VGIVSGTGVKTGGMKKPQVLKNAGIHEASLHVHPRMAVIVGRSAFLLFHYRANNKDSLLSSTSDLAREFNDRADDDRELEMEDNIVTALFVTAGERNGPADLHFSGHPKAQSERVGWWL